MTSIHTQSPFALVVIPTVYAFFMALWLMLFTLGVGLLWLAILGISATMQMLGV